MLNVEQIVTTHKDQAAAFYDLASKAVIGVERLAELNLKTIKAGVADSAARTEALLGVKDVQALLTQQSSDLQAAAEKAAAYGRELYEIASGFGTEFTKVAEQRTSEAQKQFSTFVDNAVKNAPKGAEPAAAALQNAVASAGTAFESVQKVVKQASEQAVANFNTVANSAINAADPKGKKAA